MEERKKERERERERERGHMVDGGAVHLQGR